MAKAITRLVLPVCSVALASRSSKPIEVAHAFLPMNEKKKKTQIELVASDSPHQFYDTIVQFQKTLMSLEADVNNKPPQPRLFIVYGVGMKNDSGGWTKEDIGFFSSLTTGPDGFMHVWHAQTKFKDTVPDEVTNGPP
ncbi:hypothetical protein GHT06_022832 [Daphnia sinensis]|uniref:Uncharacterized protein n=1 Tax=Daphnia sinensis TaxID=1820382 RepID=A0AAD5PLZ3_9CRUS|nr:hypothetical protein GHT06_022832 [Daphnia sinensis]